MGTWAGLLVEDGQNVQVRLRAERSDEAQPDTTRHVG